MDIYDKLEEYRKHGNAAQRAAAKIYSDISGRRGIGHELDSIDDDIQIEMLEEWVQCIEHEVNR